MAFVTKVWKDRISEYPTRRILTMTDGSTEFVTVARSEGSISQEGDAFSAENMNDLEQRIEAAMGAFGGLSLVSCTQAEYDALEEKDPDTLYFIVDVVE